MSNPVTDFGSFGGSFWGQKEAPNPSKNDPRARTKFRSEFGWFQNDLRAASGCQNVDFLFVFTVILCKSQIMKKLSFWKVGARKLAPKGAQNRTSERPKSGPKNSSRSGRFLGSENGPFHTPGQDAQARNRLPGGHFLRAKSSDDTCSFSSSRRPCGPGEFSMSVDLFYFGET